MAKRTAVARSRRLSANTLLPHCVISELAGRDCFLALGAALEVFMLGTLAQEMGVEVAHLDCLFALPAKHYHRAA